MEARKLVSLLGSGDSAHAVALKAKVPPKTLDTQIRSKSGLKPEMVVEIARAYGASPVLALVQLGLLRPEEVTSVDVGDIRAQIASEMAEASLKALTDEQLSSEMKRLVMEFDRRLSEPEGEE